VLYDSINTTNADGNLTWVRPTTFDVMDFGNDWCVCLMLGAIVCVRFFLCVLPRDSINTTCLGFRV